MRRLRPVLVANVREAARSLVRARLRTVLGLVGIMIGIASVIAMISSGEIATAQSRKQFEALGTDLVTIKTRHEARGAPGIALDDALALAEAVAVDRGRGARGPGRRRVLPCRQACRQRLRPGGHGVVCGPQQAAACGGRFVSDLDVEGMWCVVGAEVAGAMRRTGTLDVLGATLEVKGRFFEVAGELRAMEESYGLPFQVDANRSVFIPITTAQRVVPEEPIKLIVARARHGVHHEQAVRDVLAWFGERSPSSSSM